jgi:GT2 family glycosyltransferase
MVLFDPSVKQKETASNTVTVIIPTCNHSDLLEICLQQLDCQTFQSFQTVVVNNGILSPIPSDHLTSRSIKWIHLPKNEGVAAAFNRGLALYRETPYVFLLNDDAELERNSLALLVQALEENRSYSMAVPKLLQWSDPSILDGAGDEILLGGGAYRVGRGQFDEGQFDRGEPVFSACGAAALYRRTLFDEIGNFDEEYFAYYEDVDFSLRAFLRRYRCLFVPDARVRHRGSSTLGSTFHPKTIRFTTRNQILTIMKNYPIPIILRLLPRMIVYQILWLGLAISKHAFYAACMGLLGTLPLIPGIIGKRRRTMSLRLVSNHEMMRHLIESEQRIWRWHSAIRNGRPSKLLAAYFRIFGAPPRVDDPEPGSDSHAPGTMGT